MKIKSTLGTDPDITTDLAAALLRDVPRYWQASNRSLQPATDGEWLSRAEALAALTAAIDGVDERVRVHLLHLRDDLGPWSKQSADLITALLAQNATLRADKEALHLALGEASKTIVETKAERDALRAERDEALEWLSASQGYIADAVFALDKQEKAETEAEKLRVALTNLPAVYAHQINTGVREVYDPLQRFYTMESVLAALTTEADNG